MWQPKQWSVHDVLRRDGLLRQLWKEGRKDYRCHVDDCCTVSAEERQRPLVHIKQWAGHWYLCCSLIGSEWNTFSWCIVQVQVIDEINRVGVALNTAAGQKPLPVPVTGCDVLPSAAFDCFSGTDTAVETFVTSSANVFSQPSLSFSVQSSAVLQQASPGGQAVDLTSQSQTASLVYTQVDELTVDDRTQYEAVKFTLGRVPVRPPPKELI